MKMFVISIRWVANSDLWWNELFENFETTAILITNLDDLFEKKLNENIAIRVNLFYVFLNSIVFRKISDIIEMKTECCMMFEMMKWNCCELKCENQLSNDEQCVKTV